MLEAMPALHLVLALRHLLPVLPLELPRAVINRVKRMEGAAKLRVRNEARESPDESIKSERDSCRSSRNDFPLIIQTKISWPVVEQ